MSREHEFAMYRGEECLGTGTAKELAKIWRVRPKHIRHLSTPTHHRRMKRTKKQPSKARYTIKLGAMTPNQTDEKKLNLKGGDQG